MLGGTERKGGCGGESHISDIRNWYHWDLPSEVLVTNAVPFQKLPKTGPDEASDHFLWYKDKKVGTRACPNGKIKKKLILTIVKNNSYGQDFEQERGFVLVLVPAP